MKKIINILLSMGVLLMALSCVETNGLDEVPKGEICMSPVLSDMAATRSTVQYPDGSFGAIAYYSDSEAGKPWTGTPQEYFINHEFKSVGGQCTGNPSVYWPFSGSLIFAGYGPYDEKADVSFDTDTKTLTIEDYEVGDADLTYFLPKLTKEGDYTSYGKSTASVPVEFHHALSSVNINVSVKSGDESKIELQSLILRGVHDQGTFVATPASAIWQTSDDATSKVLLSNDAGASVSPARDFNYYAIPGEAGDIEIVYLENRKQKSYTISHLEHVEEWLIGHKYQYNITLSVGLEPVIIDPTKVSASIEHLYPNGTTLAGSRLNLNLGGLTDEELDRIKNLKVTATKGGVTYKEQIFATVSSNEISITEGNKLYLPRTGGSYSVVCMYNDGIEDRTCTFTVSAVDPVVKLYLDFIAYSGSVKMYSAEVNISEGVLKEVPLSSSDQYNGRMIGFLGSPTIGFLKSESNLSSPQFLSNIEKTGSPRISGYYEFQNYVTFDGLPAQVFMPSFNTIDTWASPYRVHPIKLTQIKFAKDHLKDGGLYVVCATQNTVRYWYVDDSSNLKLSESTPSNFGKEHIFRYDFCEATVQKESGYNQYSDTGAWFSMKTGKYMNADQYPKFDQEQPLRYVICATGWGSDKRDGPFDIMKGYKELLRYKNPVTDAYWSGTEAPDQYWKWNLYEVVVE